MIIQVPISFPFIFIHPDRFLFPPDFSILRKIEVTMRYRVFLQAVLSLFREKNRRHSQPPSGPAGSVTSELTRLHLELLTGEDKPGQQPAGI